MSLSITHLKKTFNEFLCKCRYPAAKVLHSFKTVLFLSPKNLLIHEIVTNFIPFNVFFRSFFPIISIYDKITEREDTLVDQTFFNSIFIIIHPISRNPHAPKKPILSMVEGIGILSNIWLDH